MKVNQMEQQLQLNELGNSFATGGSKREKPNLNNKIVVVHNAKMFLGKEKTSKEGNLFQPVRISIDYAYNSEIETEHYSGLYRFYRDGAWTDPSLMITPNASGQGGNSAAAKLLKAWAKFKGLNPNEVMLKDFVQSLDKESLKARLIYDIEKFDGTTYYKNYVAEFVK